MTKNFRKSKKKFKNFRKNRKFSRFTTWLFQKIFFLKLPTFLKFFLGNTEMYIYPVHKIWDELLYHFIPQIPNLSTWGCFLALFGPSRGEKGQGKGKQTNCYNLLQVPYLSLHQPFQVLKKIKTRWDKLAQKCAIFEVLKKLWKTSFCC